MKKFFVILAIVVLFLFANLSYGQDCGKCPLKCPGKKAISEKKVPDTVVYVKKNDKMYHQKDCKAVKEDYTGIKLSQAVKDELKPCPQCKPPVSPALPEKAGEKTKEKAVVKS